jgi:hypothetical protein
VIQNLLHEISHVLAKTRRSDSRAISREAARSCAKRRDLARKGAISREKARTREISRKLVTSRAISREHEERFHLGCSCGVSACMCTSVVGIWNTWVCVIWVSGYEWCECLGMRLLL